MLTSLHVKNLAVIEEEEISFSNGLNILTGETGAGKSVLLGSVALALGGKADKNMIRNNSDYALSELTFSLDPIKDTEIYEYLNSEDIILEDNYLTITRKLTRERSTSRINGETVSNPVIQRVGSLLLNIHGQKDNNLLLKTGNQMELLDLFGGKKLNEVFNEYRNSYSKYKACEKELANASMDEVQREHNLALINHEINEIESACLKIGEDEELEREFEFLKNSRKICEGVNNAKEMICSDEGVSLLLGHAIRELSFVSEYSDELRELESNLREAEELINDSSRTLNRFSDVHDFDPEKYALMEERLDLINRLKNKYGASIDSILEYRDKKAAEAEILNDFENYINQLKKRLQESFDDVRSLASSLTSVRRETAAIMEKSVIENLKELNFPRVEFKIHLDSLNELSAKGNENIEFYISLNPGEKMAPLAEIASGGELSRIMLSIKTAMSDKDRIPTLIFDEIDAGISGITANKVAEKLQLIASDRQVICITHLAQIASRSDHHFLIEKCIENDRTSTHIRELDDDSRVNELARIIGGDVISQNALDTARELKNSGKRK